MRYTLNIRTVAAASLLLALTGCSTDPAPAESSPPAADATVAAEEADAVESTEAASADEGTRESPLAIGTPVEGDAWTITVNAVTLDATDVVLAENEFNDEPEAGMQYLLADVTVSYAGEDSEMVMMGTQVSFVTSTGETIRSGDGPLAVAPDALEISQELYSGGTAEGNVLLQVPQGADGLLRVTTGTFDQKHAFVALD